MWFAGFTPKYSAALWWGNDVNIELTGTSDNTASLWGKIMGRVCEGTQWQEFPSMPDSVVQVRGEYYVNGTQPGFTFYDENGNAIYNNYTYDPEKKKKEEEEKKKKEEQQRQEEEEQNKPENSGVDDDTDDSSDDPGWDITD